MDEKLEEIFEKLELREKSNIQLKIESISDDSPFVGSVKVEYKDIAKIKEICYTEVN